MSYRFLAAALPFVCFASLCFAYFPESIDDAYITLRYSLNLSSGHGPVFNIGERVEGFSNPTWMALLALVGWLGFSMPLAMKLGGIISGLLTIFLVRKVAATTYESCTLAAYAAALVGCSAFFALWAADGLETVFYTCLITILLYVALQDKSKHWHIGIIAGIIALTRPEGVMFGLTAIAFVFLRGQRRAALLSAAQFAALIVVYEAFRIYYFGNWVPNTALAKVHAGWGSVEAGTKYLAAFGRDSGFLLIPLAIIGGVSHFRRPGIILAALFVLAQLVFLGVSGGDFMFGYRFIVPVLPCLALLAVGAFSLKSKAHITTIIAIATVVLVSAAQLSSRPPLHVGLDNLTRQASTHFDIADYLKTRTSSADTVLLSEAGIIPYGIKANVIDYLGLTSHYWHVRKPDMSLNIDNLLSRSPDYVVLSFTRNESGEEEPRLSEDKSIYNSDKFLRNYTAVAEFDIDKKASLLNYIYYYYSPESRSIFFRIYERSPNRKRSKATHTP